MPFQEERLGALFTRLVNLYLCDCGGFVSWVHCTLTGWAGVGFAPQSVIFNTAARPGSTDPDPESNRASRRGLLGEARGQSGKKAPVDLGPAGRGIRGRGWLVFGMGELLPLQQQGNALFPWQGRHFSVRVAHLMDLVLHWEWLCLAGTPTWGAWCPSKPPIFSVLLLGS